MNTISIRAGLVALFSMPCLSAGSVAQEENAPGENPPESAAAPDLAAQCASAREQSQKRIDAADKDDDGEISPDEFTIWREASFVLTDENGDGRISAEEHAVSWVGLGPARGILRTACERAEEHAQMQKSLRFLVMDGNGDGAVSILEYMRMGELIYSEADGNNDGKVTPFEFRQRVRGM